MVIKIKGFGWRRGFNDIRDYTPETPVVSKLLNTNAEPHKQATTLSGAMEARGLGAVPLPAVDNRKWCSPVTNQGNLGSCTAQAGVSMYEYMSRRATLGDYIDGSRLFLYKMTRFLMGPEGVGDSGAYIRTTLGAIRMFGIPPEQYHPYTDADPDFDQEPYSAVYAMGQSFKSVTQFRLDYSKDAEKNIMRIKEYLAKGFVAMTGFMVFDSYTQSASNGGALPYPSQNERIQGGHAVLIVGYDDNKTITNKLNNQSTTGAFLIQNSWGEQWGDKGYGWIPYAYYRLGSNGDVLAEDVWTITKQEWLQTGVFFW